MIRLYLCISPEEADISCSCSSSSCSVSCSVSFLFLFSFLFFFKKASEFEKLFEIKRRDGLFFLSCFFLSSSLSNSLDLAFDLDDEDTPVIYVRAKLIDDAETLRSFGECHPRAGKRQAEKPCRNGIRGDRLFLSSAGSNDGDNRTWADRECQESGSTSGSGPLRGQRHGGGHRLRQ